MPAIDAARALLKQHYKVEAALSPLPGDRDENYLVQAAQGERYVLKLVHPESPPESVDLQCTALEALQDSGLNLPRVCPTATGELYQTVPLADQTRILWLLRWCPGVLLADFRPHDQELCESFGRTLAELDLGLAGLDHPAAHRGSHWDLSRALHNRPGAEAVPAPHQARVMAAFAQFEREVLPHLPQLPAGLIHNDANDYNVLVQPGSAGGRVSGLFDFGDMAWQPYVCEVAIALAYLVLHKAEPLRTCCDFLRGYHSKIPLSTRELELLLPLIRTRLAVSIAISSQRQREEPEDPYLVISQRPAQEALARLDTITTDFAASLFKQACGLPPVPQQPAVAAYLAGVAATARPLISTRAAGLVLDLSVGSTLLGANPANYQAPAIHHRINGALDRAGTDLGYGRWAEPRAIYTSGSFNAPGALAQEQRTEHIGIDLFCAPGTPIAAPLDGEVALLGNNAAPQDYGPLVILRHHCPGGETFYTLYGHLRSDCLAALQPGQRIAAGETFAAVGTERENGGWTPHLHFQIVIDLLGLGADFPGVVRPWEAPLWRTLSPNPALLIPGLEPHSVDGRPDLAAVQRQRQAHLSGALRLSYKRPLHIVRGFRQYLYDSEARTYLDVYNNVAHVGHSHPRVVEAVQGQIALLNTNTRYLHHLIGEYAERLLATLPEEFEVCLFVNSASEANELALRLARAFTGRHDIGVMEAAYHGQTTALTDLSPYKYKGPGGKGPSDWVHEVPLADVYRGRYRRRDADPGARYASAVGEVLDGAATRGRQVAAFITETLPSVGGQIVFPPGYLAGAYAEARKRGVLCIADEVQVGFGRLGDCFWGFEGEGALPDIVVLGKPIGNGFPLGAVITRREIADAFDNGMEFFSTYGGNPVACAAGLAVLDVLEEEGLQRQALLRGRQLMQGLETLQRSHPLVGDVRGKGLFAGIELVLDREELTPAPRQASRIVNRLRELHILAGTDGPLHNVIKLRPPMVIEEQDIALLLQALEETLSELRHLP